MHKLTASFVLGYHGCEPETGEKLLKNEPFRPSLNSYDWLGSGIYFWESNPGRALEWSRQQIGRKQSADGTGIAPFVVGAVIDLGLCLDLMSANGISAVEAAYRDLRAAWTHSGVEIPQNTGGEDFRNRKLDCMVLNVLHQVRREARVAPFDTVRAVSQKASRSTLLPASGVRRTLRSVRGIRNASRESPAFRITPFPARVSSISADTSASAGHAS